MQRNTQIPAGLRLTTCTDCGNQQMVEENRDHAENCRQCGTFLPKY